MPDCYLNETDQWLALPCELNGLIVEEICQYKTGLGPIFDALKEDRV